MHVRTIFLLFFVCFANSLDKKKIRDTEEKFVASNEWKVIKEGQKVPSGLHYRINLANGRKEAKLISEEDDDKESSKAFTILDSYENKNVHTNEMEELLKKVNKNIEHDGTNKSRTLDEIKKELGEIQMKPKTDTEIMTKLFKKYTTEQTKKNRDENEILVILRELKYLGHQIDNGNVFHQLDGFRKIIYKELNSTNPAIRHESLKLLSVLAQNNPEVKVHILETGGITIIVRILNLESNISIKQSALIALSCTLRTFPYAQEQFLEIGGLKILTELFETGSISLKLKIVTLFNDLIVERQIDSRNFEKHQFIDIETNLYDLGWCNYLNILLKDLIVVDANDHDSIEKCLMAMSSMKSKCRGAYEDKLLLELKNRYKKLDIKDDYLSGLCEIISTLLINSSSYKGGEL